ncbi:MAG: hypothetical protein R2825_25785 [Saprospiraceae bacterium]
MVRTRLLLCPLLLMVSDVAGIRWMEFRRETGNNWLLHQEGTMALNDGLHRFIPAIFPECQGRHGTWLLCANEDNSRHHRPLQGCRSSDPEWEK